jgi:hypothetical protein
MTPQSSHPTIHRRPRWRAPLLLVLTVVTGGSLIAAANGGASAHEPEAYFRPGNLLVSGSVYEPADIKAGVTVLPPGCTSGCGVANSDGTYPQVWNNDLADGSFGITSPAFLDQLTLSGRLVSTLQVPDGSRRDSHSGRDHLVTSFSSKSELALNLSTNGRYVTFMGYVAQPDALDVSNSNTPGVIDPTNPVTGAYYRLAAQADQQGRFRFTETNAYSGNNGRAAILNNGDGANVLYTAGNAGNGGNPQPSGVIIGTGAQILTPQEEPERAQRPGTPTPVGSFNVTQLGAPIDKVGKDTNFRGLTIFHNVVYYTKGSGGNGVNTVYFVDTTGHACPAGVGVPQPGAALPTSPLAYDPALVQSKGLYPYNMCILQGFPTALKSATSFPFGIWFANADTVYVADEGNGTNTYSAASGTYTAAAGQTTAGLQKWVREAGTWKLAYTLNDGLNLGAPYTVPGYPTGNNPATGLPWAPATDGLRNITGRVNRDGTVTIWAVTSTVSGNGDQGADPNKLVAVTDNLSTVTSPAAHFTTVRAAGFGEVLRGVSFTPGTEIDSR